MNKNKKILIILNKEEILESLEKSFKNSKYQVDIHYYESLYNHSTVLKKESYSFIFVDFDLLNTSNSFLNNYKYSTIIYIISDDKITEYFNSAYCNKYDFIFYKKDNNKFLYKIILNKINSLIEIESKIQSKYKLQLLKSEKEKRHLKNEIDYRSEKVLSIYKEFSEYVHIIDVKDNNVKFEKIDSNFNELTGYHNISDFTREEYLAIVHPEDKNIIIEYFNKLQSGKPCKNEYRILSKDNQIIWLESISIPIMGKNKKLTKIFGTSRVITSQKLANHDLKESEELYRVTLSNISDSVFLINSVGKFIYISPSSENIYGYTIPEIEKLENIQNLLGYDIFEMFSVFSGGEIHGLNKKIIDKFGMEKHLLICMKKLDIKDGAILITCTDVTKGKEIEHELQMSNEKLRSLAIHLETVREEERKRIAQLIHNEFGYTLTSLKYELAWVEKNFLSNNEQANLKFNEFYNEIDKTINTVREICTELRPPILDLFGVIEAMKWHSSEFQKRTNINCNFKSDIDELEIDDYLTTVIYRIYQEAMTNVVRHSQATKVDIEVSRKGGIFMMKVIDNGIGISSQNLNNGLSFGLINMRERAASLGGEIQISGFNGIGTTVYLLMPLSKE